MLIGIEYTWDFDRDRDRDRDRVREPAREWARYDWEWRVSWLQVEQVIAAGHISYSIFFNIWIYFDACVMEISDCAKI